MTRLTAFLCGLGVWAALAHAVAATPEERQQMRALQRVGRRPDPAFEAGVERERFEQRDGGHAPVIGNTCPIV